MTSIKQEISNPFVQANISTSTNQEQNGLPNDHQQLESPESPTGTDQSEGTKDVNPGQSENEPPELRCQEDAQVSNNDWTPPSNGLAIDESPASVDNGNNGDLVNDIDLNQAMSVSNPAHLIQTDNPIPLVWILPDDKELCTLDEIRRGQVINKVAPNECPVPGCGKKINDTKADPSPGTISSGLRTHVIFVHYANIQRREGKKRRLGWRNKRSALPGLRKQFITGEQVDSPTLSDGDFDLEPENYSISNFLPTGLSTIQKDLSPQNNKPTSNNKKIKQTNNFKPVQPASLQSLMQASSGGITVTGLPKSNARKNNNQNKQHDNPNALSKNSFTQQTSSLFSILAGLTQQPKQQQHQQNSMSQQYQQSLSTMGQANNHGSNIPQCNNNANNNNLPVNSSLLNLLNEKFTGGLASSLQSQTKKNFSDSNPPRGQTMSYSNNRQNSSSLSNHNYQNNLANTESLNHNNNVIPIISTPNGETQLMSYDNSIPLNSFIELIAFKAGCNIGPAGIAETKKILERFTTSIICSSQTIADHYVAPFTTEIIQQKPEIGPSDVMLAYKMMQKTQLS